MAKRSEGSGPVADPGMSDAVVLEATGRDWAAWKTLLDEKGAADLPHARIVKLLSSEDIPGWWRQMVTVGYERMIGRREMGQTCAGDFAANTSRTVPGSMDSAREAWMARVDAMEALAGIPVAGAPRLSESAKWRYWKRDLADGSRVNANFSEKGGGKAAIGINHDKLPDAETADAAKAWWKTLLAEF